MGLLVSIDNGGTLTDVCATDGASTVHAKTLTTPHDLTECFVKCLEALSEKLDGEIDLPKLVGSIDYIRYSTTQGTNAIVQRKGPRIGLLTDDDAVATGAMNAAPALFEAFVGDRVRVVSPAAATENTAELVTAVSKLVSAGAARIVIAFSGAEAAASEKSAKRVLYRAFPRHLLGAVAAGQPRRQFGGGGGFTHPGGPHQSGHPGLLQITGGGHRQPPLQLTLQPVGGLLGVAQLRGQTVQQ